jgi:hypothetical protein
MRGSGCLTVFLQLQLGLCMEQCELRMHRWAGSGVNCSSTAALLWLHLPTPTVTARRAYGSSAVIVLPGHLTDSCLVECHRHCSHMHCSTSVRKALSAALR